MTYIPIVLVVEDNEINRELITEILQHEGYRVKTATNGKEGVEAALKEIPDLILMDVEMPVMNGFDATKILVNTPETSRVPVIVLTGLEDTEDRIKVFECGAMDFVSKPFNIHELVARVKSYLRFSLLNKKYVLSTISQETGLPNRAAFREVFAETKNPKLLLIKIDNLDSISRFYGEVTGTNMEKSFANFLISDSSEELKSKSKLFHLGRGLFGVLADDPRDLTDKEKDKAIFTDLLKKLELHQEAYKDTPYDLELTSVIGFERENILEKSELALEEALKNKTGILMMDEVIQDVYHNIGQNIFWLKKIKEAVQHHRLIPFYQPIFNSTTGKIEKYESLLRMIDENGNIVPPAQFLAIAKNSKYYQEITKIVSQQSMRVFMNRPEEFSVNLSVLDIDNKYMREFLIELLAEHPDTSSRLTLEIVEQEGVKQFDVLKDFVKRVKKFGVKIAMDDFGSGYSNFRTLLDMDVDFIKIDGSLIRHILTDMSSRNIVETIKTFADKTKIEVIAEYVENEAIFKCLKEMGIHYHQGYFIGKPERFK